MAPLGVLALVLHCFSPVWHLMTVSWRQEQSHFHGLSFGVISHPATATSYATSGFIQTGPTILPTWASLPSDPGYTASLVFLLIPALLPRLAKTHALMLLMAQELLAAKSSLVGLGRWVLFLWSP